MAYGKRLYESPAILLVNYRVGQRLAANARDGCINGPEKLLAQSDSAALIPDIRLGDVDFSFWRIGQFSGHTERALVALRLPRIVPKPDSGEDLLSGAPVLVFATHEPALPRA